MNHTLASHSWTIIVWNTDWKLNILLLALPQHKAYVSDVWHFYKDSWPFVSVWGQKHIVAHTIFGWVSWQRQGYETIKVAPSFWFLNKNMPIFLLKPFPNCRRKTWFKFLGGSPSKCWPNSMPVFVCIAIGKRGFLKIKSQNGRWSQLFSPKVCSVKHVLAEELKKSGCLCSKYLTSLLRHVYVNRLVWTLFLRDKISNRVRLYRGLYGRRLRHFDITVRCAAHYAGATLKRSGLLGEF